VTDTVSPQGKWVFDAEVAKCFDDMLARSIPLYHDMRKLIFDLGSRFVRDGSDVVDLGCSRGSGLVPFIDRFGCAKGMVAQERELARTDIYSLGTILYEMLTGHSPFEGDSPLVVMNARLTGDPVAPRKLNPQVSPQIEEIVLKAMAREPSDRYGTARAFRSDLDNPSGVCVTGRAERLRPPSVFAAKTRSARLIVMAVLIPLAVLLGFLIKTYFSSGPLPTPAPHPTTWKSRGGGVSGK
jgi:serine/threonine protein kinase